MWWLVVENNYREDGTPHADGLSDVTVGSMRCSFNIQQARLQWQLHKAGEAASCWSANISSEPLYGSLPATKCLYLQSACHFPLAGELVYYLAHIYLGKTFQFKSAGTTVALARRFPCGSKGQELSGVLEGRVSRGGRPFSESRWSQHLRRGSPCLSFLLRFHIAMKAASYHFFLLNPQGKEWGIKWTSIMCQALTCQDTEMTWIQPLAVLEGLRRVEEAPPWTGRAQWD